MGNGLERQPSPCAMDSRNGGSTHRVNWEDRHGWDGWDVWKRVCWMLCWMVVCSRTKGLEFRLVRACFWERHGSGGQMGGVKWQISLVLDSGGGAIEPFTPRT